MEQQVTDAASSVEYTSSITWKVWSNGIEKSSLVLPLRRFFTLTVAFVGKQLKVCEKAKKYSCLSAHFSENSEKFVIKVQVNHDSRGKIV